MKLSHSALGAHLASGKLSPVYVLTGEEEFVRELALKEIEAAAIDEVSAAFNRDAFDADSRGTSASQVVLAANQLPMLGERRLVVVRRARRLIEPQRRSSEAPDDEDTSDAGSAQEIVDYVKNPSLKTVLVLDMESPPDARRKAWKEIEKNAAVVECDRLKEWEVESWLADQARKRGVRLGREETRFLATELGSDQRRLVMELEKIALYAGGKPVGLDAIAELLGRGRAQHVFKLMDAVSERDAERALRQLGRLIDEGESPFPILALLDRRIGQLLVARETRPRDLAHVLRLPPRVAESVAAQAKCFAEKELLNALSALARTDRALKSTGSSPRLLLEGLILSICGASAASTEAGGAIRR